MSEEHVCFIEHSVQRVGMVASAVADDWDHPFRLADAGEASIPVLFTEGSCTDCGKPSLVWSRIELEQLDAIERALVVGCEGLCPCICGHQKGPKKKPWWRR